MKLDDTLPTAANLTPERLHEILEQTDKLRRNYAEQIKLLGELEHTLVAQLAKPTWMERRPGISRVRCERCSAGLGGEHVLHFEGRYWHAGNCIKSSGKPAGKPAE